MTEDQIEAKAAAELMIGIFYTVYCSKHGTVDQTVDIARAVLIEEMHKEQHKIHRDGEVYDY